MKRTKRALALLLSAILAVASFSVGFPYLKANAADITIDGVSQTRVVGTNGSYATTYENYAATYLNGASKPTNIVIPGLDPNQDYVIQGMTYYPKRDWMLVTAYHNDETASSKVFALDASTGKFVAMFSFRNVDGSTNMDHGGGIAVSEHNIYYSCGDKDQKIAYAPLSWLENAVEGQHTVIQLVDEIVLYELGSAYTAYVCYDQGVLWAGNFFDKGKNIAGLISISADYNGAANSEYNSMVFGYKLAGSSSEEEWDYLKGKFVNLMTLNTSSGSSSANNSTFSWTAYKNAGVFNIAGTITAPTATVGEFIGENFATFTLTEGFNYTIEFTSNNSNTDMYMWSPISTHCNVKQSTQSTITPLGNGRYHYEMNFTAGLRPTGADSSWPTTQSTDGSYTGTYRIRFDQDYIVAGETREFEITDIKISQANNYNSTERVYDEGSAGSPTYAIGLNNAIKDVQYAVVDNGKLYLSRSYGSGTGNSERFGFGDCSLLSVADIDLSVPGKKDISINTASGSKTIKAYDISAYEDFRMMPMSEGLCVVDDNIFITFEGASNKYMNESSEKITSIGNCVEPVDVVWQLDPYDLMELEIPEPENSIYYEKVNSLSEIQNGAEYLIVHSSPEKDSVTQKNILYALNADGGLKDYKLSKSDSSVVKGYDAMLGHAITEYSIVRAGQQDSLGNEVNKDRIYLDNAEKDDIDSVRWTLENISENRYKMRTTESYFANCNCLYFDEDQISMAPDNASYLNNIQLLESSNGNGGFWLSNASTYFLWSNDGLSSNYDKKITSYYIKEGSSTAMYSGVTEQNGTFHCDALNYASGGNIIGSAVETGADSFYADGVFYIYKRVIDDAASTYESRVYTDMNAELQSNGTYTVELETYAISPNHYQYVDERPTDYIIVTDTSSSMGTSDGTGIISYDGTLNVNSFVTKEMINQDAGTNTVNGYAFVSSAEEIYMKHTDNRYYRVKLAIHTYDLKGIWGTDDQRFWAYYVADDGLYYILQNSGSVLAGMSYADFVSNVDNGTNYTKKATNNNASDRLDTGLANCDHYRFSDNAGEFSRFVTLKTVAQNLVDQIAAQNSNNRIALVQYGADASTGFYNTSSALSTSDYANAFWSASSAGTLKTIISNMTTSAQTSTAGIEMQYAKNIVANSGVDYSAKGSRNVAVILISDGVCGSDSDTSTATTAANNNITYAANIKDAGGFVYTALIGHDSSGFDKKLYMDAISSKYQAASSMSVLGGQSVDGVTYTMNLSDCDIDYYLDFGLLTTKEVKLNSAVGLANLNASSILREELSDAFIVPVNDEDFSLSVQYVDGSFDAIGRFAFDEENAYDATGLTIGWDVNAPELITISGYDYSTEYIAQGKVGRKLKVTITGLLANEDETIQNTSINNIATTAIYQSGSDMTADGGNAFKQLPTAYFNIPEYTYVLDYGLPMLDTDVNGTLCSVSAGLTKQSTYKTVSENGLVAIQSGNQNLIYSATPTESGESGYVLIQRDSGKYDWFEIKVVPASNVLYEESSFTAKASNNVDWVADGSPKATYQSLTDDDTDVYGYDDAYAVGKNVYSNGSALKATVNSTNKRSDSATFTFQGTGFDLISACGANTGMQIVTVRRADNSIAKVMIVDTYYNDTTYVDATNKVLNQVPIANFTGDYGEYTVEVTATYLSYAGALTGKSASRVVNGASVDATAAAPVGDAEIAAMLKSVGMGELAKEDVEVIWFDDNSIFNGGTGAEGIKAKRGTRAGTGVGVTELVNYIDGIRIYHPMASEYGDYVSGEQGAQYVNVIENLVNNSLVDNGTAFGLAYVEGALAEGTALSFANYQQVGPEREFYLAGGNSGTTTGLAFNIDAPAGAKIMLGLRAINGATTVKVNGTEFPVNSATEMYYDITEILNGSRTITIANTGSSPLAVNNIKLSGNAAVGVLSVDDMGSIDELMTMETVEAEVVNGTVTVPTPEEEPEIPEDTTGDDSGSSWFNILDMIMAIIGEFLKTIMSFMG